MAIDSASKRKAISSLGSVWSGVGATPDATPDQAWRQTAAYSYPGILASAFSQASILGDLTTLFMGEYYEELKDANPNALDVDTLIRDDLATVKALISDQDDLNTLYSIYISST